MAEAPFTTPKIAAVTCNLLLGGATTFLVNLCRASLHLQPSMKLSVVGFTRLNELDDDFRDAGGDVRMLGEPHLIYEDRLAWGYRQLAESKPAAVLACLGSEGFEMLRLAPANVVRIGVIQSDDPGPYALARKYHPWIDAMVGVSDFISDRLREMPEFANKRVASIPYGIEYGNLPAKPASSPGGPLRVIYLGRIAELQKRVSRLAQLIRLLDSDKSDIQFSIAGAGPEEPWLRSETAACRNVRFVGTVPNREVSGLLAEHDVYILLSDFEGLPLSLLEAMGQGVVPVVSDLQSGIGQVVTETSGVRVPVGDVHAAASALRDLAADRARLAELSKGALSLARSTYSAKRMACSYVELIQSLSSDVSPAWPQRVDIPAPLGVPKWAFQGVPRLVRRSLKRVIHRASTQG